MTRSPYRAALSSLPREVSEVLQAAAEDAEEIRLRAMAPVSLVERGGSERQILRQGQPFVVTPQLLSRCLETATCASYHAAVEKLRSGFLPLPGGHRLGIVGSVEVREGHIHGFRSVSSLCLRIAHEVSGAGTQTARRLFGGECPHSTLLLSPPGGGKTTLLRDLVRIASDDYALRVGLVDERSEIAALYRGVPQLKVGSRTDVLDGAPKGAGTLLLLRSMNPQLLAVDEITAAEDIAALSAAANCGVAVLATAHGGSLQEMRRRPLYRQLLEEHIFDVMVLLERRGAERRLLLEELRD